MNGSTQFFVRHRGYPVHSYHRIIHDEEKASEFSKSKFKTVEKDQVCNTSKSVKSALKRRLLFSIYQFKCNYFLLGDAE